jgi:hypothetical protein
MNTPLFKQYQNSSDLISLEQVKQRITELTNSLRSNEIIFQSEIQDEIENEIQSEIDFYKMQIWCFERGSEEKERGALDRAALIKNYHNPSLYISILEARTIMSELTDDLNRSNQEEIKYYETAIFQVQQTYKEDSLSIYGYSLRPRNREEVEDKDKINSLEKKINGVEDVVYQLIGGLFNQTTQSDMIDSHLCSLNGNKYTGNQIDEDTIWPTTRQGDQHEEEIKLLKHQVSKLEDTVALLMRIIKEK